MFSRQDIEKYFLAEKQLALLFIIIGSAAVIAALVFFFLLKTNVYRGAAIPLLITGLLHLGLSLAVYRNSDAHRVRNVYAYDMNPGQIKNEELPRMKKVLKNFALVKWVEMALIATGLVLVFYHRAPTGNAFWYGLGLTLAVMTLLTFIADASAERRAIQYSRGIESFVNRK